MIPIYSAILPEEFDLPGGTTNPLLVTVKTETGLEKYVVKAFKQKQLDQYAPIAIEFYVNLFASEFDIKVPEPALIHFSSAFVNSLPEYVKNRIKDNHVQYHFGTKYYEGFMEYVPGKHSKTFSNEDIENIFAFDMLIRNTDRRLGKPNLILKKGDYLAIDHELSLFISKSFGDYYSENGWGYVNNPFNRDQQHIFLNRLKRQKRSITFETFGEYLRQSSLHRIGRASEILYEAGLPIGNIEKIRAYLWEAKQNFQKLISLCKFLIQ